MLKAFTEGVDTLDALGEFLPELTKVALREIALESFVQALQAISILQSLRKNLDNIESIVSRALNVRVSNGIKLRTPRNVCGDFRSEYKRETGGNTCIIIINNQQVSLALRA